MTAFQQQFPIDNDLYVEVSRDNNGATWSDQITLQLCIEHSKMEVGKLHLRSLEALSYSGFGGDDFFQHGLKSIEPGKGYAHRLHDFLITHKEQLPFAIRNVYSTNPGVDNLYFVLPNQPRLYLSESAIRFWNKRIERSKAEYVDVMKRYKITWNP